MIDPDETASWSAESSASGPSLSFAFNLGKILDQGEDSDPILRDGPDLGLVGVFDGMGGAGGTVYETPDGPRTGAYLGSRIARDVVERRMLELLEPDWNLNGSAAAEDLRSSVRQALEERLAELHAPPSRLRSKLLRALPTTMALVALQRTHRDGSTWAAHVFWAGDSRAYVFTADGAEQLHPEDLRDPGNAMANLHHDSVISNAMSADTDFVVNYRRVDLKAPFLLVAATDGCFGYVPTPMHFEHLVLGPLAEVDSVDTWSAAVQAPISAVTGDDAAMAVLGVGADLDGFATLFKDRIATLRETFIDPLDQLSAEVRAAELALQTAQDRHRDETAALWAQYQPGYERSLRTPLRDEPAAKKWWHHDEPEPNEPEAESGSPSSVAVRTPVDGTADGVEEPEDEFEVAGSGFDRADEVSS